MFEVGFSELLLIFVIALIVLGPERLPKLVSQVGRWAGKARAMARQFREQLESEVNLEELNKTAKTPPTPAPPPAPYSADALTPHHPAADPAVASAAAGVTAAAATADASLAPEPAATGMTHEDAGTYPYAPASPAPYETPDYAAAHAAAASPGAADPALETAHAAGPADDTPAHAKVALPPTETHERGI